MTHRRAHTLICWLLPLLALRGLVPVGFMIDVSQGDVAMVVCPGHHIVANEGSGTSGHGEHGTPAKQLSTAPCPFVVAAGGAPLATVLPIPMELAQIVAVVTDDFVGPELPFGPTRTQQSRAPPYFS